jgi:hypothetical protein
MDEQVAFLPSDERARVQKLGARAAEVRHEVRRNPRLGGEFLSAQLDRLEGLLFEFVRLSVTTTRVQDYLARSNAKSLNRQRDEHRRAVETSSDAAARDLARQNEAVLEKRLAVLEELRRFAERARGQLSLIENTVGLLRDRVVTMATPETLSAELDTLVASVDAIRKATREKFLVGTGPASRAGSTRSSRRTRRSPIRPRSRPGGAASGREPLQAPGITGQSGERAPVDTLNQR